MENEKSIEQIALEKYAEKELDEKHESIGFFIGVIVGILSAISFVWSIIHCENCLHDYGMMIFFAFIIAGIMGMFTMGTFMILSLVSRRAEKKTIRVISLLSKEKKTKVVSDYIEEAIKSQQSNISYCEKEIPKLQNEIDELNESIRESNQEIPKLEEKLKNL